MHGVAAPMASAAQCVQVPVASAEHATGHHSATHTHPSASRAVHAVARPDAVIAMGVPVPTGDGHGLMLCVVLLLAGILALITRRDRVRPARAPSPSGLITIGAFRDRGPPGPDRSQLSVWRN